jgi:hypothetical protein
MCRFNIVSLVRSEFDEAAPSYLTCNLAAER